MTEYSVYIEGRTPATVEADWVSFDGGVAAFYEENEVPGRDATLVVAYNEWKSIRP